MATSITRRLRWQTPFRSCSRLESSWQPVGPCYGPMAPPTLPNRHPYIVYNFWNLREYKELWFWQLMSNHKSKWQSSLINHIVTTNSWEYFIKQCPFCGSKAQCYFSSTRMSKSIWKIYFVMYWRQFYVCYHYN